jgi:hypothetical protein
MSDRVQSITRIIIAALVALVVSGPAWADHNPALEVQSQWQRLQLQNMDEIDALHCVVEADRICSIYSDNMRCEPTGEWHLSAIDVDFKTGTFYSFPTNGKTWAYSEYWIDNRQSHQFDVDYFRMRFKWHEMDEQGHPIGPYSFVFGHKDTGDLKMIRATFGTCFEKGR